MNYLGFDQTDEDEEEVDCTLKGFENREREIALMDDEIKELRQDIVMMIQEGWDIRLQVASTDDKVVPWSETRQRMLKMVDLDKAITREQTKLQKLIRIREGL